MQSRVERSLHLGSVFLHENVLSLRGSRKCLNWSFLSLPFVWCSFYQELQYKSLQRGLTIPWRLWYRHLLKTYCHKFLQKVEGKVLIYLQISIIHFQQYSIGHHCQPKSHFSFSLSVVNNPNQSNRQQAQDMVRAMQGEMFCILLRLSKKVQITGLHLSTLTFYQAFKLT